MITRLLAITLTILCLAEIKVMLEQQVSIRTLISAVHDRDVALDITANVVNTQQSWLDNRKHHVDELNVALSACMAQLPKKK